MRRPKGLAALPASAASLLVLAAAGLPAYLWLRLFLPAGWAACFWPVWLLPPLLFLMGFSLPRGRWKSLLRRVGETWFGLALYPAGLNLLWLLLRLVGVPIPLREGGFAVLSLTALLFAVGIPNALTPRITRYTVPLPGLTRPIRAVLLSDLHLGCFTGLFLLRRVTRLAASLSPELLLVAGDVFDEEYSALRRPEALADALAAVPHPMGAFACRGNHDDYCPGPEQEVFLRRAGLQLLADDAADAGELRIYGRRDIRQEDRLTPEALLCDRDLCRPRLVLDHNPAQYRELLQAGASLVLCGHTHNGQTFPGNLLLRLLRGHSYGSAQAPGGVCIVTSGAGCWGLPIKLGVRTEVVCLELIPPPG